MTTPSTTRQIRDSSTFAATFCWLFGLVFIVAPSVAFLGSDLAALQNSPQLALWLIFPLAGALVLFLAFYLTIGLVKYGRPVLESSSLPASCGGVLTGIIRTPRPFLFCQPIHLRLVCMKHIQSGRNSHQEAIWQDLSTLDRFSPGSAISEFPVYFQIPADALASSSNVITWRLDAKAKTQGIHYSATFIVPVIHANGPTSPLQIADPTIAFRSPEPPRRQPLDRHLHFNPIPGGGGQFEFLPGRNLALGIFGSFFCSLFIFVAVAIQHFAGGSLSHYINDSPAWFPYVFGGVGVAGILICLRLLLIRTTITIHRGTISIVNTLTFPRTQQLSSGDISSIFSEFQGQSFNRLFYCVNATTSTGSKIKLCGTIYDKADAQWLASEFKRELAGT